MNQNDEIRRLKRFIVVSWTVVLLAITGLVLWGSVQLKNLHQIVLANDHTQATQGVSGVNGQDGHQGNPGNPGQAGPSGNDGQSVTAAQIAEAVSAYLQANPIPSLIGPTGLPGADGLTQEIKVDPVSCLLETKPTVADFWTVLAQLPIPCVVSP